jgi:hypothetical protein
MSFTACYHGPCAAGDRIQPGELVKYDDEGQIVHVNCDVPSLPNDRDDLANVCRQCWTIHKGECL